MNNFYKRTLTGLVFVIVCISMVLLNQWSLLAFLIIADIWLKIEFFRIVKHDKAKPISFTSIFTGVLFILINFLVINFEISSKLYVLLLIPLFFIFIEELFRNLENPIRNLAFSILSLVYISLPLALAQTISYKDLGDNQIQFLPQILLGILVLIWIFDSMSYVIGVPLGKHRLFERVSPKKSWEGAIGGSVFTLLIGFFMSYFIPNLSRFDWISITVIVIVFGSLGDLIESLFKRSISLKDSGNTLPGHGGLLDRLDSFIFVIPWVYVYFVLKEIVIQ
ncbi:MAG: phosphatidate cytidylyltransferase [Bacteroidales bacterium]|nr:phosphatidate cytidylyltransferase [Bacteroidales bacterium]MCK9497916.1 phosphatidate cytidylyltransferase [Bacteroidales bacterium]